MVFGEYKKKKKVNTNHLDSRLIFDGIIIDKVESMRYLGVIINEKISNSSHLTTRRNMTYNAINKIGFNLYDLKYNIKSILYKTHIRPVLLYGIEMHSLNATELKNLQILEASIIKRAMGLTKKAKTTDLMNAMSIDHKLYIRKHNIPRKHK